MSRPDACTRAKEHRAEVVRRALGAARPPTPDPADPPGVLAAEGELEHAALAGLAVGGPAP